MATSSINSSPQISSPGWLRAAAWLILITALIFGVTAFAIDVPFVVLAGIVLIAIAAIATLSVYSANHGSSPSRLIPNGMSSAFSKRLSGDSMIVGRTPCCDISLPLPTISGHHCRFFRKGHAWYIEDLASSNGTFVNDRRIRKCRIQVGDKITVGELVFEVG